MKTATYGYATSQRSRRFRQYSHTETIQGYDGEKEHINMNVFNGNRKEFEDYVRGEK